jgi:cupin 2 domain-containing protein
MTLQNNIFDNVPETIPAELLQTLLNTDNIRIERIVSHGHASPIQFEGDEPVDLIPGSFMNIPAHQRHRVDWTEPNEPTIWLAIYYS